MAKIRTNWAILEEAQAFAFLHQPKISILAGVDGRLLRLCQCLTIGAAGLRNPGYESCRERRKACAGVRILHARVYAGKDSLSYPLFLLFLS